MDWSILLDCFITINKDLSLSIEDNQDESVLNDIQELKSLLSDDNKVKIDRFTIGLTNHLELVELEHLKKAIHFGFQCGMEVQKMLDIYLEN